MVVADTSALIGAWHAHYRPGFADGFWNFLDGALRDGRVIVPSIVFDEIGDQSDGLYTWLREREALMAIPDGEVQKVVGYLAETYRFAPGRDRADPFVIAEAQKRGFAVATYEGRSPTGSFAKAKANVDRMPSICEAESVECLQPGDAWQRAGLSF